MKKVLFLILIASSANAQVNSIADVKQGDDMSHSGRNIGSDEKGFYMRSSDLLEHYDWNNKLIKSIKTEDVLDPQNKDRHRFSFSYVGGKLLQFSTFTEKKKQVSHMYVQTIDKETLLQNEDTREIVTFTNDPDAKKIEFNPFYRYVSDDASYTLILAFPEQNKTDLTFTAYMLNADLNKQWSKKFSFSLNGQLFNTEDVCIDKNGHFMIMGKLFDSKADQSSYGGLMTYHLIYCTENASYDNLIAEEGKKITSCNYDFSNDKLYVTGYYSLRTNVSYSAKGSFFLKMNPSNGKIEINKTSEFPADYVEKFEKNDVDGYAGKKGEIYSLQAQQLFRSKDRGIILIAEQYIGYSGETQTTYHAPHMWSPSQIASAQSVGASVPSQMWTTTTRQTPPLTYANNILVTKCDSTGTVIWSKIIPKAQVSSSSSFMSFSTFALTEDFYFIFNDNKDNLNATEDSKVALINIKGPALLGPNKKQNTIVIVKVSGKGEVSKQLLLSSKESSVYFINASTFSNGRNLLFTCEKDDKEKLAGIIIK